MTEEMQNRLEKEMKAKINDKKVGIGIDYIKGEIKNLERKERKLEKKGEKWRKRGVMFHFSSTNHQRRPTTGLPVGQDC